MYVCRNFDDIKNGCMADVRIPVRMFDGEKHMPAAPANPSPFSKAFTP
jgi:hypothetical protein